MNAFEAKILEWVAQGKLDDAAGRRIIQNPQLLEAEIELREKHVPTKSFIPNRGQERFLSFLNKPNKKYYSDGYPPLMIFTGGNGVGKTTTACAEVIPGICFGKSALNPEYGGLREF